MRSTHVAVVPERRRRRSFRRWLSDAFGGSSGADLLDPYREPARNLPSVACSLFAACLLCLAAGSMDWFQLRAGGCSHRRLGLGPFVYNGLLVKRPQVDGPASIVWQAGDQSYVDCVNSDVIVTIRTVLVLLLLGAVFTLAQLLLDLCTPSSRLLKVVQFNATGSVTTCLVCAVACGLAYWAAQLIRDLQERTRPRPAAQVDVAFCAGYYAVGAAGLVSVCAAAFNCLRPPPPPLSSSPLPRPPLLPPLPPRRGRRRGRRSGLSVNSGDLLLVFAVPASSHSPSPSPSPSPPPYESYPPPAYTAEAHGEAPPVDSTSLLVV